MPPKKKFGLGEFKEIRAVTAEYTFENPDKKLKIPDITRRCRSSGTKAVMTDLKFYAPTSNTKIVTLWANKVQQTRVGFLDSSLESTPKTWPD